MNRSRARRPRGGRRFARMWRAAAARNWRRLLEKARLALDAGLTERAGRYCEEALVLDPDHAEVLAVYERVCSASAQGSRPDTAIVRTAPVMPPSPSTGAMLRPSSAPPEESTAMSPLAGLRGASSSTVVGLAIYRRHAARAATSCRLHQRRYRGRCPAATPSLVHAAVVGGRRRPPSTKAPSPPPQWRCAAARVRSRERAPVDPRAPAPAERAHTGCTARRDGTASHGPDKVRHGQWSAQVTQASCSLSLRSTAAAKAACVSACVSRTTRRLRLTSRLIWRHDPDGRRRQLPPRGWCGRRRARGGRRQARRLVEFAIPDRVAGRPCSTSRRNPMRRDFRTVAILAGPLRH